MKLLKLMTAIFISVVLGAVFIFSGVTKLFPVVETFEFTFVEIGISNWYLAPVFARVLIGLEFFTGLLLIANYNLRKFTLPVSVFLLGFFIIYLLVQIYTNGNEGNCGCFGEFFKMTPLEAILKNLVMIAAAIVVYRLHCGWKLKSNGLLLSLTGVTAILLPFILNPIDYSYTSNNLEEKINYKLELDLLFEQRDSTKVEKPLVELRSGKHVLAFLSLTCPHCIIAAKKLSLIKKNAPAIPVYFLLNGQRSDLPGFLKETKSHHVPSTFCHGKTFVQLASASLPRIYYLDNSIVVKKVDYFELSQYHIEKWLNTGNAN